MRQTFVVVSIVVGLILWVVAIASAEPVKCRLAVLQASAARPASPCSRLDGKHGHAAGSADDTVAVVAIQTP